MNFSDANCSSVLAKVRSKAKVIVEDNAIEENTSDGDLFGSKAASLRASRKTEAASPQLASSTSKTSADLFSEQYAFVWDRLGPNPTYNSPQIRANALRRILHHSQKDPAQLDKFAELVAKWRANGRSIDRETTLEFIGALRIHVSPDNPLISVTKTDAFFAIQRCSSKSSPTT